MRNLITNISIAKLLRLPEYIIYFFRSLLLFKAPFSVLSHYINKNSTLDRPLEFRNGLKIQLSNHPHDLITVFVVFVKKDYGDVLKNNIVVDIGANIGAFSLLAAKMGAKKVFAYEPNQVAFKILQKNISN